MFKNIILFFALYVSLVFSREITFKVISFGSKNQIQIVGGKEYNLSPVDNDEILYGGKVSDLPATDVKYYYIVDGVKEPFTRIISANNSSTDLEFYGREHTVQKLQEFSYPDNHWNRATENIPLFDSSYIPTVHIVGGDAEKFFTKPKKNTEFIMGKVTFYFKDKILVVKNVKTTCKNKNVPKFQIKMEFDEEVYGRNILKFRNSGEDPTNLRQFTYGNMIHALGMPSLRSNMVRVYYNKKPAGFYVLQDEAYSEGFLRTEFYNNDDSNSIGCAYDGTCGADVDYPGDETYGPFDLATCDTKAPLMKLGEALSKLDPNDANQVKEYEKKWFDIDTFHKAMAIEYLTGDWDGYWFATSNYVLYNDPSESFDGKSQSETANDNSSSSEITYKFYFLTQDHDETFGIGLEPPHNNDGMNFTKLSYKTMLREKWHVGEDDAEHRVLVDKFIGGSPALQSRFENTLKNIVKNIFNPKQYDRVLNSYFERYEAEMNWDYSFERAYKPTDDDGPRIFSLEEAKKNIEGPIDGVRWGIKDFVQQRAEALQAEFGISW